MSSFFDRVQFFLSDDEPDLQGVWERHGDSFAGCRILVRPRGAFLEGVLVALPAEMQRAGWGGGEIKWRQIQPVGKRRYKFEDCIKKMDLKSGKVEAGYQEGVLVFQTPYMLRAQASGMRSQRWHRVHGG